MIGVGASFDKQEGAPLPGSADKFGNSFISIDRRDQKVILPST